MFAFSFSLASKACAGRLRTLYARRSAVARVSFSRLDQCFGAIAIKAFSRGKSFSRKAAVQ